jgi:Putative prokaryotic signal transducing protein
MIHRMANDSAQDRSRLLQAYRKLSDGELEKTAGEAYELTDVAREVLRGELARRGLQAKLSEHPEDDEPEMRQLVTLRKFRDLPEALLAKGSLESAGIDCNLADDNMVRLDWFYSNAIGGIKLLVDQDDLEAAEQLLTQPIPEHFEVSEIGDFEQPRCPKCGSLDVNFRELDPAAYLSLAAKVPIPFHRQAWHCRSCNAEWEEDDASDGEQLQP